MDTVTAVKIVKDKNVIGQFTALISEEQKKEIKQCGYDGSLHFFKNNAVVQDVDFRMNDAHCMFFTAKYQGEVLQTVLSPEAKQLLESVKK